jgi:hypothetical protein
MQSYLQAILFMLRKLFFIIIPIIFCTAYHSAIAQKKTAVISGKVFNEEDKP